MKRIHFFISLLILPALSAISQKIDSTKFFADETPFEMTLTSDLKTLMNKRMQKSLSAGNCKHDICRWHEH